MTAPPIVLASQSKARIRLLSDAGLEFTSVPAQVDEDAIRSVLNADNTSQAMPPDDVALILAEAKANAVAEIHPHAVVIGADQILEFEGEIITKAANSEAARKTLIQLRGRTHRLISAVVIARQGQPIWRHTGFADLKMRDFSNVFLGQYLAAMGDRITQTVGGYEIEGRGIQLFEEITGDIFTIQGLPLLPLLAALRREGIIK